MLKKQGFILFLFSFFAVLTASAQRNSLSNKTMHVKADTTLVVKQQLNVSKLEPKKQPAKEKREKFLGVLVEILRDLIKDNQVN